MPTIEQSKKPAEHTYACIVQFRGQLVEIAFARHDRWRSRSRLHKEQSSAGMDSAMPVKAAMESRVSRRGWRRCALEGVRPGGRL